MSSIINVNTALGKDFVKLSGPENYDSWMKDFEPIANVNGYLGLYLGHDDVVGKPTPPSFIPKAVAPQPTERRTRTALPHSQDTENSPPSNYQYALAVYNAQVQDWKDNDKNVQSACALLRAAVEPWIWKKLPANKNTHPAKALTAIIKTNKAPDSVRVN